MANRLLVLAIVAAAILGAAACGGGDDNGPEPEIFAEFADDVARAAEDGDVAFFIDRVQGSPRTCTEELVSSGMCTEVGAEFQEVLITNFGVSDQVVPAQQLITDLEAFFEKAEADKEDGYGPGSVRLYATGRRPLFEDVEPLHTAILSAILTSGNVNGRFARGVDFEYLDGRWVIGSETTANPPIAVELLEEQSAGLMYEDWTAY